MPIEAKRKEGENINALLYRFNKKLKQSGVLKEAKKRRFRSRDTNKNKRRAGAIYRTAKAQEIKRTKKLSAF